MALEQTLAALRAMYKLGKHAKRSNIDPKLTKQEMHTIVKKESRIIYGYLMF